MIRRGRSDHMCTHDCAEMETALRCYIADLQRGDCALWRFGVYGDLMKNGSGFSEKSAPVIPDLVAQPRLWKIFLEHMPGAKMKDSQMHTIMARIISDNKHANNTALDDEMFVTWWCRACHLSLSHLRALARYPDRFQYRVSKLSGQDAKVLGDLLGMVKVDTTSSEASTTSPTSKRHHDDEPCGIPVTERGGGPLEDRARKLARITRTFLPGEVTAPVAAVHASSMKTPQMFLDAIAAQPGPGHSTDDSRIRKLCMAVPPLPCNRGGIRDACETAKEKACENSRPVHTGDIRPFIERHRINRVRTSLRVLCPGDSVKRLWVEVSHKQSDNHEQIIRKVADGVRNGVICSKEQAKACAAEMLA